jgi:hypothetical protein
MVGGFGRSDGNSQGALISRVNCSPVDYPGGHDRYANGSNAEGDLVGRYTEAGTTHGFLWPHYIPRVATIRQ